MAPVLASLKVPSQGRGELLEIVESRRIAGKKQGLAGSPGEAGIAANAQMQLIGAGETIANIASVAAVEVRVVDTLAVRMKVGARRGVVESAEESAYLRSPARGGIAASLGEKTESGNSGCAAAVLARPRDTVTLA